MVLYLFADLVILHQIRSQPTGSLHPSLVWSMGTAYMKICGGDPAEAEVTSELKQNAVTNDVYWKLHLKMHWKNTTDNENEEIQNGVP